MSELYDKLKGLGCDVEKALERFLDDGDLYLTCLQAFAEDEGFEKLGEAIKADNHDEIFQQAHTLKGVSANLELATVYQPVAQIVADIRAERFDRFDELYAQTLAAQAQLKELIA